MWCIVCEGTRIERRNKDTIETSERISERMSERMGWREIDRSKRIETVIRMYDVVV